MMKTKLKAVACKAFAYFKGKGYQHLIYPGAPIVRSLDFLFGSECKYCMATRALVFGVGLGVGGWIGLSLVASAVVLSVIERFCKGH
jgi:hypothetical protein